MDKSYNNIFLGIRTIFTDLVFSNWAHFLLVHAEKIAVIICTTCGILFDILVLVSTGRLLTTRIRCSSDGIECSSWFGLSKGYLRWEDCVGYGLLNTLPSSSLYGIKYLYFSDRWYVVQNGIYEKVWGDMKGERFHPKKGPHFFHLQYTSTMMKCFSEYMPEKMYAVIEQQINQGIVPTD